MTTDELRKMPTTEIVETLVNLRPTDEAVAFLAALIADGESFAHVRELRRRFLDREVSVPTEEPSVGATTVQIDREAFRAYFSARRISLSAIGPLFGRCRGWGSVILHKGHAGFYALDELARALDTHVDDLVLAIGTEAERRRVALAS